MNDASPTPDAPTPDPAATAQPDAAPPQSIAALTDAVRQLAHSHHALLDALRPRADGAPAGPPPTNPAPLAADVRRVVADVLAERDAASRRAAGRDRYVRDKLADLPDAYRRLMPDTDDEAALAAAERDVRRRYRDDLRAFAGPTFAGAAADVAGGGDDPAGNGQRPGAAVDYSALSPLQQIALGLKGAKPAGAARPPGPKAAPDPDRREGAFGVPFS